MKYCTLFLLLMGGTFFVCAQPANYRDTGEKAAHFRDTGEKAAQRLIAAKCKPVQIILSISRVRLGFPALFREISVIDLRRDTSRLGIVSYGGHGQQQVSFRQPGGVAGNFAGLLDSLYTTPGGTHSLLVAIKDCWLSDPPDSMRRLLGVQGLVLAFRLEAYLKNGDGYTPLVYLDTVVAGRAADVVERGIPMLTEAFMDKVVDADVDRPRRRTVSVSEIDSFAQTRYHYPMDTATRLVKGVYTSVEEFRDNRPSIKDYEFSKDPTGNMELRVRDSDGRYYFTHTVWGLCTGSQVYLMMDGNLFPVYLVGHQFYVLGSPRLQRGFDGSSLPLGFLPLGIGLLGSVTLSNINTPAFRHLRVFRLDAETGMVMP